MADAKLRWNLACASVVVACASRTPPVAEMRAERVVAFSGMCDASGAIALTDRTFVVADDEDNVLRTYDVERGGPPLSSVDLSSALGLRPRGKKALRIPESDIEAATRVGHRAYWITSHGRSSKGRLRPERLLLFSTTLSQAGVVLAGARYDHLLDDILEDASLAQYGLARASELPPKAPGGLAIEGLTAAPGGELWVGFRNPVPGGRALLLPLLNASQLVDGPPGVKARFGPPALLDLGGYGVRALTWWRGRCLIVAGPYSSGGRSRLYEWRAPEAARQLQVELDELNPEGFFTLDERDAIMLLSDDGARLIDGKACKDLPDAARKSFRGLWVQLPSDT